MAFGVTGATGAVILGVPLLASAAAAGRGGTVMGAAGFAAKAAGFFAAGAAGFTAPTAGLTGADLGATATLMGWAGLVATLIGCGALALATTTGAGLATGRAFG